MVLILNVKLILIKYQDKNEILFPNNFQCKNQDNYLKQKYHNQVYIFKDNFKFN